MTIKTYIQSKNFTHVLCALGTLIILLAVFQAGIMVGVHKAKFSFHMGENYYRAFEGADRHDRGGIALHAHEREFTDAHGAVGKILKVALPTLIVLGPDQIEKTVIVGADTTVRHFRDAGSMNDLAPDQYIVVIGSPNDRAELNARLIRILPPPPQGASRSTVPSATSSSEAL